ncbi:MAG: hypothetical protein QUS14_08545 [Pyrinomonadaceae bacterium]|nr:hypothetical protein [Pyrinomonadaceae bacterium]
MGRLKRVIMWDYGRETSVYVIFCLLIVAFIFLTPKTWFDKRERLENRTSRIILQASDYSGDRAVLEQKVRELSGNPAAVVVGTRERQNARGEKIYEIDIR